MRYAKAGFLIWNGGYGVREECVGLGFKGVEIAITGWLRCFYYDIFIMLKMPVKDIFRPWRPCIREKIKHRGRVFILDRLNETKELDNS